MLEECLCSGEWAESLQQWRGNKGGVRNRFPDALGSPPAGRTQKSGVIGIPGREEGKALQAEGQGEARGRLLLCKFTPQNSKPNQPNPHPP